MLVGRISLSRILFDSKRGFWTGGDHPPALLATPPVVRGSETMMLQLSIAKCQIMSYQKVTAVCSQSHWGSENSSKDFTLVFYSWQRICFFTAASGSSVFQVQLWSWPTVFSSSRCCICCACVVGPAPVWSTMPWLFPCLWVITVWYDEKRRRKIRNVWSGTGSGVSSAIQRVAKFIFKWIQSHLLKEYDASWIWCVMDFSKIKKLSRTWEHFVVSPKHTACSDGKDKTGGGSMMLNTSWSHAKITANWGNLPCSSRLRSTVWHQSLVWEFKQRTSCKEAL